MIRVYRLCCVLGDKKGNFSQCQGTTNVLITTDSRLLDSLSSPLTQKSFDCALDAITGFSSNIPRRFAAVGQKPGHVLIFLMTWVCAVCDRGKYRGSTIPQTSVSADAAAAADHSCTGASTDCSLVRRRRRKLRFRLRLESRLGCLSTVVMLDERSKSSLASRASSKTSR